MSEYPEPMKRIEDVLRVYGGWSRLFRISAEEYDKQYIVYKESEQGFWIEYAKALADEQFREAIEEAVYSFREAYPEIKLPIKELRMELAKALLAEGWKPIKAHILKEIRDLKRKKKEEIQCLRNSLKKGRKPPRRKK